MAFPVIPTTAAGRLLSQNQNNTTAARTFPSLTSLTGKASGHLLVAIVVAYQRSAAGATFGSWGGGFSEIADLDVGATDMAVGIATKTSTGSETGTFTVTQAATVTGHCSLFLMSIEGWDGATAPEFTALAVNAAAAADPGALNPSGWDNEETLWIAVAGNGETNTGGSWTGLGTPTPPTNYGNTNSPGIGTDAVGGIHSAVAFRQNQTASEDVGTWGGQDVTNARNCALLIAIRPVRAPVTSEKTGSGIRGMSGDVHWVGTRVKSGRGLLGLRAYAGTGVSENVGSGTDAVDFTEAGSGISANVGSGVAEKVTGGASNDKTGAGERGHVGAAVDVVVFVDSGAGVSANIASGTDAVLFVEAGAGVSPRVASGTDAVESTEAGVATSARIGAATDAVTAVESGTGILALTAGGVAEEGGGTVYTKSGYGQLGLSSLTAEKTGAGVRGHVGSATDSVANAELGSGILSLVASGVSERSGAAAKTGSGVSARSGAGDQTVIYVETSEGYEVEPPFLEGDNPPQLGHVGSGVSQKITGAAPTEKTGAGLRGHSAAATDTVTSTETGAGTSPHVGSGSDAATFVDSGAGIRGHVGSGVGSRGFEAVKTGSATSTRVAAGVDAVTYTDTASGVRAHVGSALDSVTSIDAGTGIRGHTGSGEKFKLGEHVKFGLAVSARIASGTNTVEIQLPPPGTLTVTLSGRFSRTRRGNLTNARRGGVVVS